MVDLMRDYDTACLGVAGKREGAMRLCNRLQLRLLSLLGITWIASISGAATWLSEIETWEGSHLQEDITDEPEGAQGSGVHNDPLMGPHRELMQSAGDLTSSDLAAMIADNDRKIAQAKEAIKDLKKFLSKHESETESMAKLLSLGVSEDASSLNPTPKIAEAMKEFEEQCQDNYITELTSSVNKDWAIYKGYACEASESELRQYMSYKPRGLCPDDWLFVQHLIFVRNCHALPRRRCMARTPQDPIEPLPRAVALFNPRALEDRNVRWGHHGCGSFSCLNGRTGGDCKSCFNMTLEANRWRVRYRGSLTIREVVEMKGGALRLGLDAGRGTGSFAAHLSRFNVTVVTMAMDIEVRKGEHKGLPYMESIAQRGLIPLHAPHTARLPFFDNTFDLVHCVNSVKYLPLGEFEDLLYEWDRILRAGGIIWFELFYAPEEEMKIYVQIIDLLKYRRLYWEQTKKPLAETKGLPHVYLNAVIEKPARLDSRGMEGRFDHTSET